MKREKLIHSDDPRIIEAISEFISGCNEIYTLMKKYGKSCLGEVDTEAAKKAFRNTLGYFEAVEEFEKCSAIKKFYETEFQEKIIPHTPTFLNGQS